MSILRLSVPGTTFSTQLLQGCIEKILPSSITEPNLSAFLTLTPLFLISTNSVLSGPKSYLTTGCVTLGRHSLTRLCTSLARLRAGGTIYPRYLAWCVRNWALSPTHMAPRAGVYIGRSLGCIAGHHGGPCQFSGPLHKLSGAGAALCYGLAHLTLFGGVFFRGYIFQECS